MEALTIGPIHELIEDVAYAMPVKACLCFCTSDAGTFESSMNTVDWTPITLDDNGNFQNAAPFIRVHEDSGSIRIVAYTIQS